MKLTSSLIASRTSLWRSIRVERRFLLGLTVGGFVPLAWVTAGEPTCLAFIPTTEDQREPLTLFLVLRSVFSWTLWFILLGMALWEGSHVKKHYPKTEWGSSIQSLESLDSGVEDVHSAKLEDETYVRDVALVRGDSYVTPYREGYTTSSPRKSFDSPPGETQHGGAAQRAPIPFCTPSPPREDRTPVWKARLVQGEYVLGPDPFSGVKALYDKAPGSHNWTAGLWEMPGGPAVSNVEPAAPARNWVPEDRCWGEKAKVVEECFGPALYRTQSM